MEEHTIGDVAAGEPGSWASDNIFADLKVPDADTELLKSDLAARIRELAAARGQSQTKLAGALGLKQPALSRLCAGNVTGFSVERLFTILARLGQEVTVTVSPRPLDSRQAARPALRLVAASAAR